MSGDSKKGAKLFKTKCAQCHTISPDGQSKQGPPLWNLMGRVSGTSSAFGAYSDSLKNANVEWNNESLHSFLINPKKYIKGTKMNFAGLKKESDRNDLISYLEDCRD
tara:strand:+ start:41 stop:361 length:321 start_codon:yes stop_codon:yes gene_type:complete